MIVDSSPIIFLSKIGRLNLLNYLFKSLFITSKVKEEVLVKDKVECRAIEEALKKGWLKIRNPKNELKLELGNGEQSAISLAYEIDDCVVLDDATATKAANSIGLKTLRTTSIIFMAVEKKLINRKEAEDLINKLIKNGYYIKTEFYADILMENTCLW